MEEDDEDSDDAGESDNDDGESANGDEAEDKNDNVNDGNLDKNDGKSDSDDNDEDKNKSKNDDDDKNQNKKYAFAIFPSAVEEESWRSATVTTRERAMWAFMDAITDKPEWARKVFDDKIVAKWYAELRAQQGGDPSPDAAFWNREPAAWPAPDRAEGETHVDWARDAYSVPSVATRAHPFPWNRGFSDVMFAWCVRELRDKARVFERTGIVSALESSAAVFKSDSVVPESLREKLCAQAARLEDVPEAERDWHPGSDNRVLDLVHPSLFPLVYGRTRGFTDRVIASPDAALALVGAGEVIGETPHEPTREEYKAMLLKHMSPDAARDPAPAWERFNARLDRVVAGAEVLPGMGRPHLSKAFQWLPAEVELADGPGGPQARFASYINNLHPKEYRELYGVCGDVLSRVLPMLDAAYARPMSWDRERWAEDPRKRINAMATTRECSTPAVCGDYCSADNMPTDEDGGDSDSDSDAEDEWEKMEAWYDQTHPVVQPNPSLREYAFPGVSEYKTSGLFSGARRLQVIVKMANIHLTPEDPAYPGGGWHLEGLHNERIAATALYYYDVSNISESRLALRTNGNGEGEEGLTVEFTYDQNDHAGPEQYFDIDTDWDAGAIMDHGSVSARQGRVLVFPNTYQHRVEPFALADRSRPGHRKILAFFLVDPATPVVSTHNVPPQQAHWGHGGRGALQSRLPEELVRQVLSDVHCPYDLETAKRIRLEFMAERSAAQEQAETEMKRVAGWSFCEH